MLAGRGHRQCAAQQRDHRQRPFDAPPEFEELPAGAARHVFGGHAGEGRKVEDHLVEHGQDVGRRDAAQRIAEAKIVVHPLQDPPASRARCGRGPPWPRVPRPPGSIADCPADARRRETPSPAVPWSRRFPRPWWRRPAATAVRTARGTASVSSPRLPGAVSLISRVKMLRSSRAEPSARSTCRPSQNRLSATRLGRSMPLRRGVTGVPGGCSSVTGATGPSANTHTSLLPCPTNSDSPRFCCDALTCASAPGMIW